MQYQKRNKMANNQQIREIGNAIGFLSVADIQGLTNLLAKYGNMPNDISYQSLNNATIDSMSNPNFSREFVSLVSQNVKILAQMNGYNNVTGDIPSTTSATTPATTSSSGGFFSGFNLGSLLNLGSSVYGSISADKRQKDLLNAQANQNSQQIQSQIQAGNIALETERLKLAQIQAGQGQGGANNTMLYVGLGLVGLLVVGGVIYAVAKK